MNIFKSLDVTKATGPEKISNNILKHCASTLCHPLSKIFILCFSSGTFPIKWKEAHVQPIPQKGKVQIKMTIGQSHFCQTYQK